MARKNEISEKSLGAQLVGGPLNSCVERDLETGVESFPSGERQLGLIVYAPYGNQLRVTPDPTLLPGSCSTPVHNSVSPLPIMRGGI